MYGLTRNHNNKRDSIGLFEKTLLLLGVISFVNFDYLNILGLSTVVNLLQIAMIALSVIYLFVKQARIGAYQLVWLTVCIWIPITTIINGADLAAAMRLSSKMLLPMLFFTAFKDDFHIIMRIMYVVLGVLTIANLVTIIAFPNGMYVTGVTNLAYENWLLGFKNKHIVFYLPLMLATFCLMETDGVTWDKVAILTIVVLASLLAGSSTTIVCMALMIALVYVPFFRRGFHVFNARTYLIIWLIAFILVVLLRVQNGLLEALVGLFGKDMTFSNRTLEWDIATREIASSPLVGVGYLSLDLRHILYMSQSVMSAHDQLLEYAFVGGAVLVILYLTANFILVGRLQKYAYARVVQFAAALYLGMLVVMLTEVYEDVLFYALYFMLWNVPSLVSMTQSHKEGVIRDAKTSR